MTFNGSCEPPLERIETARVFAVIDWLANCRVLLDGSKRLMAGNMISIY